MTYRRDIQILRAFAVILVVLFHLNVPLFAHGFLGVDIFFVISGFLMAQLFDRGTVWQFYWRRVKRIGPAYVLLVFSVFAALSILAAPVEFRQVTTQVVAAAMLIPNLWFWSQDSYFDSGAFKPLLHLWSLGVEIQFYLIVPPLFALLKQRQLLTIVTIFISFGLCLLVLTVSPKSSFFLLPTRIWEFLIGAYAAWHLSREGARLPSPEWLKYSTLGITFLGLVLPFDPTAPSVIHGHPSVIALVVALSVGILLAIGLPRKIEDNFVGTILEAIGNKSYEIYLAHFPIIVIANYRAFGGTQLGAASIASMLWIVGTSIMVTYGLYHLARWSHHVVARGFLISSCLVIVLAISGVGFTKYNSTRFTEQQRYIFSAWFDRAPYRCGKMFRILHPWSRICRVTNVPNERARVLLIGDSHADAIKRSFGATAENHGINVYFYVPSPLVDGTVGVQQVIDDALRLGVSAVVLDFSNGRYQDEGLIVQIVELFGELADEGISYGLIAPVPTYTVNVPSHLLDLTLDHPLSSSTSTLTQLRQVDYFGPARVALAGAGATVKDPATILCVPSCAVADSKGRPYYFDSNHLTLTGSDLLSPLFSDLLEELMSNSASSSP